MYVKFSGICIKHDKTTFNPGKTVNIYIVYDLKSNLNSFDPTLQNCLFGAIKLTKNSDTDEYEYAGYGIGFDSKGTFSHQNCQQDQFQCLSYQKKYIIPSSRNISVTKKSRVSAENIGIKVSALPPS